MTGTDDSQRSLPEFDPYMELLSEQFPEVALFGLSPLVGTVLADFDTPADERGMVLDTTLLTEEESIGQFVFVAGNTLLEMQDITVIQEKCHRKPDRGG